jgi:septation ring formation regulator EzrA
MEQNVILQAIKELQVEMKEGFTKLETRMDSLESRMLAVEEGQQELIDSVNLLVKENWNTKKDIVRIEKSLGMNGQF